MDLQDVYTLNNNMAIYKKSEDGANLSRALIPNGSPIVDVTGKYAWTLSKNRAEVPSVQIEEFQINTGQLVAGLYYYTKQGVNVGSKTFFDGNGLKGGKEIVSGLVKGGAIADDPYKYMYWATPTGFIYNLPWLGDEKFSRSNSYAGDDGGVGKAAGVAKGAAKQGAKQGGNLLGVGGIGAAAAGGNPAAIAASIGVGVAVTAGKIAVGAIGGIIPGKVGTNKAKSWDSTSATSYTVNFDLLNTFNNTDDIRRNRELAYLLTYQSSPFRRNFAVTDPPCIYKVNIPDVVHLPAAHVSSLAVTNLGNTRLLNLDGQARTIPEAYRFSITFEPLLEESRNIFAGVETDADKVEAISEENIAEALKEMVAKGLVEVSDVVLGTIMN